MLIPVAKFDYVEAQDDYVALAAHGAKHLKQQTIASLEAGLETARFVRIHRSYIVNFERVARIEPYGKDSRLAILIDGTRLPVGRTRYARLKSFAGRSRLASHPAHPDAGGRRLAQLHGSPAR